MDWNRQADRLDVHGGLRHHGGEQRSSSSAGPVVPGSHPRGRAAQRERTRTRRAEARRKALDGSDEEGFLRRRKVTDTTRAVYSGWVTAFQSWCGRSVKSFSDDELDSKLDAYVLHLYKTGEGVDSARTAVYAVAWATDAVTRDPNVLSLAKASLAGFAKKAPPGSRDPLPWDAVLLEAEWMARNRGDDGIFGASFLLTCFDTYARPSEQLGLLRRHVTPPIQRGTSRTSHWAVTFFPSDEFRTSKTRQQDDTVLVGNVGSTRQWLGDIVKALYHRARRPDQRLFPISLNTAERLMKEAAVAQGLVALGHLPHMLRHGGPSQDMLAQDISKVDVASRGRWACLQSCNRYEKRGRLVRQLAKLSAAHLSRARVAQRWLEAHLPGLIRGASARPPAH